MSTPYTASAPQSPVPQSTTAQLEAAIQSLPLRRLGLAMRFQVVVSGVGGMSLGHWTSCEGLKVEFKYDAIREGGDCSNTHVLPKTIDYSSVTLKRAVEYPYSLIVQRWLGTVAAAWQEGDVSAIGSPVVISLLDAFQVPQNPAAEWVLADAFPVSWSGPTLGAKSNDLATETLVLQHSGFLGASSLGVAALGSAGTLGSAL